MDDQFSSAVWHGLWLGWMKGGRRDSQLIPEVKRHPKNEGWIKQAALKREGSIPLHVPRGGI